MQAIECGAAALASVLAYYKHWVPLEVLRDECGISRDGSNAKRMVVAARERGATAEGFHVDVESLDNHKSPLILFWDFDHFVVYEGRKGDAFFINDPAEGRRRISRGEFSKSYTGIALEIRPGPDFEKTGSRAGVLQGLRKRLLPTKSALAFALFLGLLLIVPGVLMPGFAKVFIDDVMLQHKSDWLAPLLLLMVGTALLRFILTWMQEACLLRLHTYLALALSSKFLLHVLRLPVVFFERRMPGDIAVRVMSNSKVASMLSGQLATAVISLLTIVFYAIVMFLFSVPLAIIGVGVMIINLVALRMIATGLSEESRRTQQEYGLQYGVLMNGMQVLEPLRAVGRDSDIFDSWYGHQARAVNAQQKLGTLSSVLRSGPSFLQELASNAVILGLGGYLVLKGDLSLGTLFAVQILMGSFLAPVAELVGLGQQIQELRADITRLDDVMDAKVDPTVEISLSHEVTAAPRNRLVGDVEMRDIVFGYDPHGSPLLDGFGLLVPNGGRVAIVGASGSGKTTVARLLAGLWHPWSGEILIANQSWGEIPREIRAASVAFVDQQISLFKGTVRDNLTLWDTSVPETDIAHALEDACIREELEVSVGGVEGIINEGGDNLSGGQRQRLEIARALVQNPSILVLDEATSALDPATELKIDRNLRSRGCTTIIVAHRLSTIRDADEIIVLDQGKVVERGKHDALLSKNGTYAELVKQV